MSEEGGWGSADVLDIMQGATIIVNGGTIGSTEHYSSAINCQGGKVMISGGSFLTSGYSDYSPVKMSAGADMTIDGGTFGFEGMGASVFTIGSDVTLTINGGEFLCGGVWHLPDYVYEAIKKEDPTYTDEDIAEEKEFMATNRPIGVFQITGGNNNITISAGRFYGKYTAMDNGWNLSVNTLKQYLHISGGEWETSDIESYR